MARNPNTRADGNSFDRETIEAVWHKGQAVAGYNPDKYRRDTCGALIERSAHGSTSATGWEVDHIRPVAKGGSDELTNLQPLNWQNNRHKSDNWPNWSYAVQG